MKKIHYRPGRAAAALLALLAAVLLLAPQVLADSGESAAPPAEESIIIGADGKVTLHSIHLADEKISSLQLRLAIEQQTETGTVAFSFAISGEYFTRYSVADGTVAVADDIPDGEETTPATILTIYIAGADPLMAPGTTDLLLGTVTGAPAESIMLAGQDALQVVYGSRMAARTVSSSTAPAEPPEESEARKALGELLEQALALEGHQDEYGENSWTAFLTALGSASEVYEDENSDDEQLLAAAEQLRDAIERLASPEKEELASAIAVAEEFLASVDKDQYGTERLEKAIADAKALLAEPSATEDQISDMVALLSYPGGLLDAVPDNPPHYPGQTDKPETDAPETDAPETDAPETDAPETDTPGTDTPETDDPETDTPDEPLVTPTPTAVPTTEPTAVPVGGDSATAAPTATAQAGDAPQTGDETVLLPWAAMLCLSCGLLVLVIRRGKAKR